MGGVVNERRSSKSSHAQWTAVSLRITPLIRVAEASGTAPRSRCGSATLTLSDTLRASGAGDLAAINTCLTRSVAESGAWRTVKRKKQRCQGCQVWRADIVVLG